MESYCFQTYHLILQNKQHKFDKKLQVLIQENNLYLQLFYKSQIIFCIFS